VVATATTGSLGDGLLLRYDLQLGDREPATASAVAGYVQLQAGMNVVGSESLDRIVDTRGHLAPMGDVATNCFPVELSIWLRSKMEPSSSSCMNEVDANLPDNPRFGVHGSEFRHRTSQEPH